MFLYSNYSYVIKNIIIPVERPIPPPRRHGVARRKHCNKDTDRGRSFADRLKETLARGQSNDESISRPMSPEPQAQPSPK